MPTTSGRSEHRRYRRILGESAAKYLEADNGLLVSGQRVGISCGSTLRDTVTALSPGKFSKKSVS